MALPDDCASVGAEFLYRRRVHALNFVVESQASEVLPRHGGLSRGTPSRPLHPPQRANAGGKGR